jgi:predicted  nucleic acid-binding Zn-ribbon protein
MNEPFLLSNLIELQELDNEIFKLISEKSEGTTVKELKTFEIEFKKLQSDKQNIENELQLYFDTKNHIEKSISESQLKIDTINEKLNTNLDASELQNYNLQKQNFEKNLLDYEKSLNELNEENSDELERINKIDQSLESLKPTLLSLSKTLQNEWRDIDLKIGKYEEEKKLLLSSFPEGIIDLYDDLKSKGVEVIAAYKRENQCGCCGVDLTSNEMYEIMNSSFQQCPYCMGVVI